MAKNSDNWEVTANRFVVFIDIMGFKDMVARLPHNTIYRMMKKIDEKKKINASIKWAKNIRVNTKLITTTTYSDSIIIYSKDNSYNSLLSIVNTTAALTNDLMCEGIPHKGAMAFGKMTLDTHLSIFLGQPLIDSYLLQEDLNFYGIVIHASAHKEIDRNKKTKEIPFLKNFLCPFKNGAANHLTIYPMYSCFTGPTYKAQHDKLFESLNLFKHQTSGHLRKYIDTTELYLNKVKEDDKIEV